MQRYSIKIALVCEGNSISNETTRDVLANTQEEALMYLDPEVEKAWHNLMRRIIIREYLEAPSEQDNIETKQDRK